MVPADTFQSILQDLRNKEFDYNKPLKMIGLLLTKPKTKIGEEIASSLHYFNLRSETSCNFYFMGYGAYWHGDLYEDEQKVGKKIDGIQWLYSDIAFETSRKEIVSRFKYKYSGESDLLLLSVKLNNKGKYVLDEEQMIILKLEEMLKGKVISSIGALFEEIFDFCENYDKDSAVLDFSEKKGKSKLLTTMLKMIFKLAPKEFEKLFNQLKYFAVLPGKKK